MTLPDAVLRLFQLHPFPLPFTDSHFIMPDPANQATILAVIISYIIHVHYFVTLKKRVVNIILRTLPESIVNMIRPPQIPVADHVPPPVQQPLLGAAA